MDVAFHISNEENTSSSQRKAVLRKYNFFFEHLMLMSVAGLLIVVHQNAQNTFRRTDQLYLNLKVPSEKNYVSKNSRCGHFLKRVKR